MLSTLAYLVLFLLFREVMGAQWSNALALLITAIANTAANRRVTFGVVGNHDRLRHQAQGLLVFAIGLTLTSGSLLVLHAINPTPSRSVEVAVLVLANIGATLLRFLLFRAWVFRRRSTLAHIAAADSLSDPSLTYPTDPRTAS